MIDDGPAIPGISPKPHKLDYSDKRELHDAARELLGNAAFRAAVIRLRNQWFAELLQNGGGDLTAARLCARIEALESIPAQLGSIMNDFKHA